MKTRHQVVYRNSNQCRELADRSVDLVVTSPPYPMIEMWDAVFTRQNPRIGEALDRNDGPLAFERMHIELDKVWDEVYRVLKPGGIAAVNIGDATRTIGGRFSLYTSHARIQTYLQRIGFSALPAIIWRKQTNAPNKFMGSGMMPPGAYVTLEHEYVLILRKGDKREFPTLQEKQLRRESGYFWEERNQWFSDVWTDLKGTTQQLTDARTRKRSGAFPFELPYRLISMFSLKNDTVLDPFFGIGTTMVAAQAAGRNSVGYEIEPGFHEVVESRGAGTVAYANQRIRQRLEDHRVFVESHFQRKGKLKYSNRHYRFPVVTGQEQDLLINPLTSVERTAPGCFEVRYDSQPQPEFVGDWEGYVMSDEDKKARKLPKARNPRNPRKTAGEVRKPQASGQINLFD